VAHLSEPGIPILPEVHSSWMPVTFLLRGSRHG